MNSYALGQPVTLGQLLAGLILLMVCLMSAATGFIIGQKQYPRRIPLILTFCISAFIFTITISACLDYLLGKNPEVNWVSWHIPLSTITWFCVQVPWMLIGCWSIKRDNHPAELKDSEPSRIIQVIDC